jgi:hypothetical protein
MKPSVKEFKIQKLEDRVAPSCCGHLIFTPPPVCCVPHGCTPCLPHCDFGHSFGHFSSCGFEHGCHDFGHFSHCGFGGECGFGHFGFSFGIGHGCGFQSFGRYCGSFPFAFAL